MGFFEDWKELLDVEEKCIKYIVHYLHQHCAKELETLGNPLVKAPADVPFPRLTFAEAQQLYFERTGIDERHEPDLSPAAEAGTLSSGLLRLLAPISSSSSTG